MGGTGVSGAVQARQTSGLEPARHGPPRSSPAIDVDPSIPRLIVGMPRSGTTWLCRSLNTHPLVAAFGETMFWGKSYVAPDRRGRYPAPRLRRVARELKAKSFETTSPGDEPGTLRMVTPERLLRIVDEALEAGGDPTPADVFTRLGSALARAEGRACWVEKTPHHVLYHARILAALPRTRFVVMIREPYAFAKSYKHQPGHERTHESRKRFDERYHPLGAGLVWRRSFQAAMHLSTAHPDRALLVRCEELAARPAEVLSKVLAFLDIPDARAGCPIAGRVNSAFAGREEPELEEEDVFWFNLVARREIQRAGYRARESRASMRAAARRLGGVPAWVARVLKDTKRSSQVSGTAHLCRWLLCR
jgi:hypothetical protein